MTKKLFAAILAVMVLCSTAGATDYVYNGKDGLDWENAYIINSAEDMDTLALYAGDGKFYKLSADITLTAKPRWAYQKFNGYLDGQNHTIDYSEVSDMPALFYEVSVPGYAENPAIQKLNVKGTVTSSYDRLGGIVRYLSSGIIDSCTFTGSIRTTVKNVGGIVGYMKGGTIKNCTVSGTFRASSNIGGIVGYMDGSTSVENCTVLSGTSIAASGGSGTCVGGIAGYMYSYMHEGKISGCTSYAVLSDAAYKGGILGYLSNTNYVNHIANNKYANVDKPIGNMDGNAGVNNTKIADPGSSGNNTGEDSNTDGNNSTDGNSTDGNNDTDDDTDDNETTSDDSDGDSKTITNGNKGRTNSKNNNNGNTDSNSSDDDDSGCNSGIPALMLAGIVILKSKKH